MIRPKFLVLGPRSGAPITAEFAVDALRAAILHAKRRKGRHYILACNKPAQACLDALHDADVLIVQGKSITAKRIIEGVQL